MSLNNPKQKRVLKPAFLVAFLGAVILLFGWLCPIRYTFGIPCPGCGMTRSLLALLQGDLKLSWFFSPMVILSLVWLLFFYPFYTRGKVRLWLLVWMALMALVWLVRMLLYFPAPPMAFEENSLLGHLIDLFGLF